MTQCFHCGQPVPPTLHLTTSIEGQDQPMCCYGCQAVSQAIVEAGLQDFYRYRDALSPTAKVMVPAQLQQWQVYDHPQIRQQFVQPETEDIATASLILEGITCAACIWLNEKHLLSLPGVLSAHLNYTTHRAQIRWDERQIQLSAILQAIESLGYRAHPYDPKTQQRLFAATRKQYLLRMAVAGFLGMQVMMTSVALYQGAWSGIESEFRQLFQWLNFGFSLPVLLYSAYPFFKTAWHDFTQRRISMDVPVSLGIAIAFMGSVWATVTGVGEVYYDSVVMFVFFLLTGRYFELMARQRGNETLEALALSTPALATRLTITAAGETDEAIVPVVELRVGDRVLIRPGETIPADGEVVDGSSSVNEALLTGEHAPILKLVGARLVGGSVNIESPLQMRVMQIGDDTLLASILRLLERAQTEKPAIMQLTDKIAAYFVGFILILAALVASYWAMVDPTQWLPILFAVLVVTCPCALSLATPAAISAAMAALSAVGVIATRGHVLETLAQTTDLVFDKTGTLTQGQLQMTAMQSFIDKPVADCLALAKALEQSSEHPIAQAFKRCPGPSPWVAEQVTNEPGAGLSGWIAGQCYYLGTAEFIQRQVSALEITPALGEWSVYLANQDTLLAGFNWEDALREDALLTIQQLQAAGYGVHLLSGDHPQAVAKLAQQLGINHYAARLKPADKLVALQQLQQRGAVVMMVGDGVNDAPVLAAAQVSVAMSSGADLAKVSADMLLLGAHLQPLCRALQIAKKCQWVIRQNLFWAAAYNIAAVPAAALGWVPPWLATIGMSLSSLGVVLNALRLTRAR